MSQKQNKLTAEQSAIVAEFVADYGIETEDILFFSGEPKPFFTYEATCQLCNHLTDLHDIDIQPIESVFEDSITLKCTVKLVTKDTRSAVGVANFQETADDVSLNEQQIYALASSRAIRNALKTAGIDLFQIHNQIKSGNVEQFKAKSNFASLLAQAHVLGTKAGIIKDGDKSAWYSVLWNRYKVQHSNELAVDELADFIAVLNTLVPQQQTAKAA